MMPNFAFKSGEIGGSVWQHEDMPLNYRQAMSKLSFNIEAVIAGKARLSEEQALELYHHASLHDLGQWAHATAQRMHPEPYRTYVIDRNINYTNVCTAKCTFCAFRRDHEDQDSYTLSYEKIGEKIRELVAIHGTQILMQGGMNDRLPLEWYEGLLRYIKSNFPTHFRRRSLWNSSDSSAWMCATSSAACTPLGSTQFPAGAVKFLHRVSVAASASGNAPAMIGCG